MMGDLLPPKGVHLILKQFRTQSTQFLLYSLCTDYCKTQISAGAASVPQKVNTNNLEGWIPKFLLTHIGLVLIHLGKSLTQKLFCLCLSSDVMQFCHWFIYTTFLHLESQKLSYLFLSKGYVCHISQYTDSDHFIVPLSYLLHHRS